MRKSYNNNLISVNSAILKLEQDAEISLFMRGMIPNNRTPDIIASNTAILQKAIDDAWLTGKKITGLHGIYSVNQVIYKGAFQITGSHIFKTGFQAELAGQPIFKASNDCQSTIGMRFENFICKGIGRNTSKYESFFEGRTKKVETQNEGGTLDSAANRHINFKNIALIDFSGYAVTLTDSFNCHFEDCYFIYNGKEPDVLLTASPDIYEDGGAVRLKMENWKDVSTTGLTFTNCYLGGNNISVFAGKIIEDQAIGIKFTKTIFESSNYAFYAERSKDITFDNCYFEGHLIKAVKCGNARFIDCYQYPPQPPKNDGTKTLNDTFDCYGLIEHSSTIERMIYDSKVICEIQHNDSAQHISQAIFESGAIKIGEFGNVRIYQGQKDPENIITASAGSLHINDTASTIDKMLSIKLTGKDNNTGWVALSPSLNLLKPSEQLHTTGASLTVADQTQILIINPEAILPVLNITLNQINDLKRLDIVFGGTITVGQEVVSTLTITAPVGTKLMQLQALTKAFSGNTLSFIYNTKTNTFTRLL